MFRKIVALLLSVLTLAGLLSSCGKKDTKNKGFAYAVSEMPRYFDPQASSTDGEKIIAVNSFDGLFKLCENGELENCCAEDYQVSSDGLTYLFKIKKGLTFYINSKAKELLKEQGVEIDPEVKAKDFEFGIKRALAKETESVDFALLRNIKNAEAYNSGKAEKEDVGVTAKDDYTLQITLERPDSNILYALSQPCSFPCNEEFFNATKGRYGLEPKYTINNGSFYLSKLVEGKSVKLSKNEEYKGSFSAVPASVTFYLNSDDADVAKKLDKEGYDCGFFEGEQALKELKRGTKKTDIYNITKSLIFNFDNKKVQNLSVRTGLCSSVDVQSVSKASARGIAPSVYGLKGKGEGISFNIETARNSLVNGFKEMEVSKLEIQVLCIEKDEKLAKSVVNRWQKNIGVELVGTVKAVPEEEFYKLIETGEYESAVYPVSSASRFVSDFFKMFTSGNEKNVINYQSDEYDRICGELMENPTVEKALYCESYLLKNAVMMPLTEEKTVFAVAKNVNGVYYSGDAGNVYFYKGEK